jgi:ubiquinone/menaquinone biosynthesis C-methylase UbiE
MDKGAYKTTYDNEKSYWWYQARADIVTEVFAKSFQPGKEMLNIGCGTGLLTERFSRFGFVASMDFSPDALNFCAQNRLDSSVQADGVSLPFHDQSFDVCLAFDVLEHIKDDRRAVSEIMRVLKPGGAALITVPAFQWLWSKWDELGHFRRYTRAEIKTLLDQAGFETSLLTYYNFFLFPLAVVQKMIERFSSREVNADNFLPVLPPPVNQAFYRIFSAEKSWLGRVNFPFGVSVLALARKKP